MSNKSDWVSYIVALLYMTILVGCGIGFRKNLHKKRALSDINEYEKQRRVICWRFRFYYTLFSATLIRIIGLLSAVITHQQMILAKAVNQQQFVWSAVASVSSLLYFTAFTFIIWFFAHLAFHQQLQYKRLITPFFTALNVTLYVCAFSIGISCIASTKWELVYDYVLPLFAICVWILAACFIFLSHRITFNIAQERQDTLDYMEYSRRVSTTHSQHRVFRSPLIHKGSPINCIGGVIDETSVSNQYMIPLPPNMEAQHNEDGMCNVTKIDESQSSHIISRLIKLSVLCAICWFIRGTYLMALRIWPSTDKTPLNIPELAWEALFYCFTEYPPCLGALTLMIAKPKKQTMEYPAARQQRY
eukprot:661486_1